MTDVDGDKQQPNFNWKRINYTPRIVSFQYQYSFFNFLIHRLTVESNANNVNQHGLRPYGVEFIAARRRSVFLNANSMLLLSAWNVPGLKKHERQTTSLTTRMSSLTPVPPSLSLPLPNTRTNTIQKKFHPRKPERPTQECRRKNIDRKKQRTDRWIYKTRKN